MQTSISNTVLKNCINKGFMKDLIEIIEPRVVIALGSLAFRSIAKSYALENIPLKMKDSVEYLDGFEVNEGKTRLFPAFHCGAACCNMVRNLNLQKDDWQKIKKYLDVKP
jgi:uracil-DNA glycosylase